MRRRFPGYGVFDGKVTAVTDKRFEVTFEDKCALHALSTLRAMRAVSGALLLVCFAHAQCSLCPQ